MANEKAKEGVNTEDNDHININDHIKSVGQDGSVVQFKIKRHIPLSKLMQAILEMEDEDAVDVFQQQTRGVH
uniref:small ubiquitin-related modifier 2-like n=1 Tax=Jaculus jaculus TaxID=51337 RepID=UPI001E1B1844|nr:small ubiquitin-related modifier 2-like [Jaculus jaculus]